MMAARNDHPAIVKMLVDKGADLNAIDNEVGYNYTCIYTCVDVY